jgi:hypothetical protein
MTKFQVGNKTGCINDLLMPINEVHLCFDSTDSDLNGHPQIKMKWIIRTGGREWAWLAVINCAFPSITQIRHATSSL